MKLSSQVVVLALAATLLATGAELAESTPRLFFLDLRGRVVSANPDGSDVQVLADDVRSADGVVVDPAANRMWVTRMGSVKSNDGSIEQFALDGSERKVIVTPGGTFTPKQAKLDSVNGKLYWSDREGMRVMRSNLDGTGIEILVVSGSGDEDRRDAANWCVGIAVDVEGGHVYWTQKGSGGTGTIRRAGLNVPEGEDPAHRSDIEILFAGLPEPIDLDLDLANRTMYWTDRGDPPTGNSVSRAPMDPPVGFDPSHRNDQQILVTGLNEGIGIALDTGAGHMYFTDLRGSVYSANLDGSNFQTLLTGQGSLTGIAFVELSR